MAQFPKDGYSNQLTYSANLYDLKGKTRALFLEFGAKIEAVFAYLGGIRDHRRDSACWKIPTKAGNLNCHIAAEAVGLLGTVFTRFEQTDWGVAYLGARAVNRFSGKWNHHYFGDWTPENAVFDFLVQLNRITIIPVLTDDRDLGFDGQLDEVPGTRVTERMLLEQQLGQKRYLKLNTLREKFAEYSLENNFPFRYWLVEDKDDGGYKIIDRSPTVKPLAQQWKPKRYIVETAVPKIDFLAVAANQSHLSHDTPDERIS